VEAKMDQIKADMAADDGADYVKLASQQKEMDELSAEFDQLFERFAELDDYVSGE